MSPATARPDRPTRNPGRPRSAWNRPTPTGVRNVHERIIAQTTDAATAELARLADPEGAWPADRWPPLRLAEGLSTDSRGGHGPIRYHVESVTGTTIRFRFHPPTPLVGWHGFEIAPHADSVCWRHTFEVEPGTPLATWLFLPLHDGLLEDLLDTVAARAAGKPVQRARLPLPVRLRLAVLTPLARLRRRR